MMLSGRVRKDPSSFKPKRRKPRQDEDYGVKLLPSFHMLLLKAKRKMRPQQTLLLCCLLLICVSVYYLRTTNPSIPLTTPLANGPLADEAKELVIEGVNTVPTVAEQVGLLEEEVGAERTPDEEKTEEEPTQLEEEHAPFILDNERHPILQLMQDAEQRLQKKLDRQSETLEEAVAEYKRRYHIPPPPHFDKWYEFAKKRKVVLIDEFDGIHQNLKPFWALKPSTIRARAREALGGNNNLLGLIIRDGDIVNTFGGKPWLEKALQGMLARFVRFLPDMDLCFNIHDESRVVIPHDDLEKLTRNAMEVQMPAAAAVVSPRNSWSERPPELGDGSRMERTTRTRFNIFAHQSVWSQSKMSCPIDSPARDLEDGPKIDNNATYAVSELGFIYDRTVSSDICQNPSYSENYGFFAAPNAMNVAHDLFPIFSESKISSYSDILYPSPWYWSGRVVYNETEDMPWEEKKNDFYWRGSSTGGYSRNGGWRHQHRQRFVQKINAKDQATILDDQSASRNKPFMKQPAEDEEDEDEEESREGALEKESTEKTANMNDREPARYDTPGRKQNFPSFKPGAGIGGINEGAAPKPPVQTLLPASAFKSPALAKRALPQEPPTPEPISSPPSLTDLPPAPLPLKWLPTTIPRSTYKPLINISFSHIGQCDPGDCAAQREFFTLSPPIPFSSAWSHKFLLDMDGNAFSGRFYSFLRSKSQVFKMAIFREWHDEWLMPWRHFVPLSLRGEEWLEAVRWFAEDDKGKEEARRMAEESRAWADRVVRNADLEVWFFRLLLEYGRVVDEGRGKIGFAL